MYFKADLRSPLSADIISLHAIIGQLRSCNTSTDGKLYMTAAKYKRSSISCQDLYLREKTVIAFHPIW